MKNQFNGVLWKGLLCVAGVLLIVDVADAKSDKGNGNGGKGGNSGKGGGAPSSEKQNPAKGGNKDLKNPKDNKENKAHKNHDHGNAAKHDDKSEPWRSHRFEDRERNVFLDYFKGYQSEPEGLPPGLAKKMRNGKPLPPGWQKKVTEGYVIDDDAYGFFNLLEDTLFPGLKPQPNTRLYLCGDRIVRVYEPRRQVIDVFPIPSIKVK